MKILIILMALLLTACGPIYETTYSYVPPRSPMGKMCISQCVQSKAMCEQMAHMQDENRRAQSRQDAMYRYQAYREQQIRIGQPINKDLRDFEYGSFSYGGRSYDCLPNFNMCYQSCGGQVMSQRVCTAFCNQ